MDQPIMRIVQLANEGRLAAGDKVSTPWLGVCTVAWVKDATTITVKTLRGAYVQLQGINFGRDAVCVEKTQ